MFKLKYQLNQVQYNQGEDIHRILINHTYKNHFNTEQLFHLTAHKDRSWAYFNEEENGRDLDIYLEESKKKT